jgi:hypothetical protein
MSMAKPSEELRSAVRFPIKLPVQVKPGAGRQCEAETRNISAGGVMFYASADMEVGSRIEFSIAMPAEVLGTAADVKVRCTGRVVRCSQEGGRRAVAAVIDEYRFDRG